MEDNNKTFFGSKKVPKGVKNSLVDNLFSNVSTKYDIMNDLMSFGIHRIWKDIFLNHMDNPNAKLLDVAGGTCDVSKRFYEYSQKSGCIPDVTVCDINYDMLSNGKSKMENKGYFDIKYVNSKAEELPFVNNYFDYYSVSFGIRNFGDIEKSLNEANRVLKKGGKFLCLEFSKPENLMIKQAYNLYSNFFIPNLGSIMGDRESYQYLVDSIETFPNQESFTSMINQAGFKNSSYRNLSNGIVAIHTAYKL